MARSRASKERHLAYSREYYKRNAERLRAKGSDNYKKRVYGLSPEAIQDLLERQKNVCALCGEPFTTRFVIDHDHGTGKVRGLVHDKCNTALGQLDDDPVKLLMALDYLRCQSE